MKKRIDTLQEGREGAIIEAVRRRTMLDLYQVLARLKSEEEFRVFFEDLCTFQEVEKMEQRVQSAQLLIEGDTYNQVIERTNISSATLSRVSRCIQHGSGGYSELLKKMMEEK